MMVLLRTIPSCWTKHTSYTLFGLMFCLRRPPYTQSRSSSLRSLIQKLHETSDSLEFYYRIDTDCFKKQWKWPKAKVKHQRLDWTGLSRVFVSLAGAIQPEVRYFWTPNQNFLGSILSRPLVKRNEGSRYEAGLCKGVPLGNAMRTLRTWDSGISVSCDNVWKLLI